MTPFERTYMAEDQVAVAVHDVLLLYKQHPEQTLRDLGLPSNAPLEVVAARVDAYIREHDTKCEHWRNDTYQVTVYRNDPAPDGWPQVTHLSIKRIDRETLHDWRELQQIKSELCGPECEAIELYPAESRTVDMANQYHLWCLPEGIAFPIGFNSGRRVFDHIEGSTSKQRTL